MSELSQAPNGLTSRIFFYLWQVLTPHEFIDKTGRYTRPMPSRTNGGKGPVRLTPEEALGVRMRQLRGHRKLKEVDELAQLGVPKLSSLERGAAHNPTLGTIVQVARGLKVPLASLFTHDSQAEAAHAETGGRSPQYIHPALQQFVDRISQPPAAGTWQRDVLDAMASLTRALQRNDDTGTSTERPAKTGR